MMKNSKLQVLGIVGSPRQGGNTDILVDQVLTGAEEMGASIEKVILNKLNINPCQACNSCYKTGKCMHNDDMEELLEKMEDSALWVLGTPVYWWGPTAQFKAFLDRWYCPKHETFKGKHVILVIPLEGSSINARHTIGILTDVCNYLGIELDETVLAPGMNEKGAVLENVKLIKKAYNTGKKAIKMLINS
ncbi:MAG: flavodoxin family protein [Candidatus Lokiarchaeota archaeon]|nr:flavodoxin family protein [Candidatus Lokiarchaeota archaeon]